MTNTAATPTATAGVAMTFRQLIASANESDYWEESALEYISDYSVPLVSHSRETIYRAAWLAGWRPGNAC